MVSSYCVIFLERDITCCVLVNRGGLLLYKCSHLFMMYIYGTYGLFDRNEWGEKGVVFLDS